MDKNDIIEYVMNTPHNTNRAVLSSMLNQLTEDGSGLSDFSVATLTITASNNGVIYGAPIIMTPFPDSPSFKFIGTASESMDIGEYSVVMYKGYSAVMVDYDSTLSTVTTSGAIEKLAEEEGYIAYKITGDCTITIS